MSQQPIYNCINCIVAIFFYLFCALASNFNKRWVTYITANGERISQSADTADKKKAQELADRLKAQYWDHVKLGTKPTYYWKKAGVKWVSESAKKSISDDIYNFPGYLFGGCNP